VKPHSFVPALLVVAAACASSTGPSASSTAPGGGTAPSDSLAYAGTFHGVSTSGQGMAQVYILPGGSKELRFTSTFATEDNPDVEVWLVAAPDVKDNVTVLDSAHVSLGSLKSGTGAQSYAVPDSVAFTRFQSVSIWCVVAQLNFATAPLAPE
jgi:Electron transfer DM13